MDHADQLRLSIPLNSIPLALARGLLLKGVKATQLARVPQDEILLTRIAALIAQTSVVPKTSRFLFDKIKRCGVVRAHGVTRHADKGFEKTLHERERIIVKQSAQSLLKDESVVGTNESTLHTLDLIPLKLFAIEESPSDVMNHKKICKLLGYRYPKFSQEDVDASLMVAMLRDPRLIKLIAKNQKLDWIALLHKPVKDLAGDATVLRIVIKETGTLMLDAIPIRDDMLWSTTGAFAVLSH